MFDQVDITEFAASEATAQSPQPAAHSAGGVYVGCLFERTLTKEPCYTFAQKGKTHEPLAACSGMSGEGTVCYEGPMAPAFPVSFGEKAWVKTMSAKKSHVVVESAETSEVLLDCAVLKRFAHDCRGGRQSQYSSHEGESVEKCQQAKDVSQCTGYSEGTEASLMSGLKTFRYHCNKTQPFAVVVGKGKAVTGRPVVVIYQATDAKDRVTQKEVNNVTAVAACQRTKDPKTFVHDEDVWMGTACYTTGCAGAYMGETTARSAMVRDTALYTKDPAQCSCWDTFGSISAAQNANKCYINATPGFKMKIAHGKGITYDLTGFPIPYTLVQLPPQANSEQVQCSHEQVSDPVDSKGGEIAVDAHRGIGITIPPSVQKVKQAHGTETAVLVTCDVACNVKDNYAGNVQPTPGDVTHKPLESTKNGTCFDATASDLFWVGRGELASKVTVQSKFKCAAHALRNLVISVCDSVHSDQYGHYIVKAQFADTPLWIYYAENAVPSIRVYQPNWNIETGFVYASAYRLRPYKVGRKNLPKN